MDGQRLLLVEGSSDVDFFRALLRRWSIDPRVEVVPPRTFDRANTVTVIPSLLPLLVRRMQVGSICRLAIAVDADHDSGGGFSRRWLTITDLLRRHGYRCPKDPPKAAHQGSVFLHTDGLPSVGLWLMPNHAGNGMLEDMLLKAGANTTEQQQLLQHATAVINTVAPRLSSERHTAKATVYSWLSYQRRPGLGLGQPVHADLLDFSSPPLQGLRRWIERVFGEM